MSHRGSSTYVSHFQRRDAYAHWKAPSGNRQLLVSPDWDELPKLARSQHLRWQDAQVEVCGVAWNQLVREARQELFAEIANNPSGPEDSLEQTLDNRAPTEIPIIASGHQPTLFHPGVWYKNFMLRRLACQVDGIAVNLIIDSDLCRIPGATVPSGPPDAPNAVTVPYDRPMPPMPWEERTICDQDLFRSFPSRLRSALSRLIERPMVDLLWERVATALERESKLGRVIARGRHAVETEWVAPLPGEFATSWEVPISRLARTGSFRKVAAQIFTHIAAFQSVHNGALADYRQAHRIRNHAHPVPDLAHRDCGWETPFWVWTANAPERRPLFVDSSPGRLRLCDADKQVWEIPVDADNRLDSIVAGLARLESGGVKIRSRALVTTAIARMLWSDLFIHGIGGAKYDQVTDRIVSEFFGIAPPAYAVVTATHHLPIALPITGVHSSAECRQMLRELRFHPETLSDREDLNENPTILQAYEEKLNWIATPVGSDERLRRHQAIAAANEQLRFHQRQQESAWQRALERAQSWERTQRILHTRETPFCAFPLHEIGPMMLTPPSADSMNPIEN